MATSTFVAHLTKTEIEEVQTITLGGYQTAAVCPPPVAKKNPGTTSPHQLFLASIGSCVNLVFEIALKKARVDIVDLHSEIHAEYETDEDTGQSKFTTIYIDTAVTVPEGVSEKKINRLFDMAHASCPIGNCLIGSCVKLVTNLSISFQK